MKRLGHLLAATTFGAAAMAAGFACSSFTAADSPDAAAEAGDDSGGDGGPACTFPASPPSPGDDSDACACPPDKIFTGTLLDDAFVAGGTVYGRTSGLAIVTGPVSAVTPPKAFATSSPTGDSLGMFADAKYLYVATTSAVLAYDLKAAGSTNTISVPGVPLEHVAFGSTVFYTWNATGIAKRTLAGVAAGDQTAPVTAVAVDGDEAYFTVTKSGDGSDPIASFTNPSPLGRFPDPVKAIAVKDGVAYAASVISSSTVISRVVLSASATKSTTFLNEFGLVARLAIDDGRLYWTSRRGVAEGVILASSDLCGGDYRLLAKNLPDPAIGLSFDATFVYVAGNGEELRQIPKKP